MIGDAPNGTHMCMYDHGYTGVGNRAFGSRGEEAMEQNLQT
jgi:hypothetical protein